MMNMNVWMYVGHAEICLPESENKIVCGCTLRMNRIFQSTLSVYDFYIFFFCSIPAIC